MSDTTLAVDVAEVVPVRRRMPTTRNGLTHKFTMGGQDGYIIAGLREDGRLGEIFIHGFGKEGSTLGGFVQSFCKVFSIALQYGAPLDALVLKLVDEKFEPNEWFDGIDEIKEAPSIIAYVARWLAVRFGDDELVAKINGIER